MCAITLEEIIKLNERKHTYHSPVAEEKLVELVGKRCVKNA
jgi:hypothetical protein